MGCPWLFKTLSGPLGTFRTGTLCPAKSKLCLSPSGSAPRPRSGRMQCLGPVPATGAPAAMCPIAFCWDYLCQPRPGQAVCQGLEVLLGGVGDASLLWYCRESVPLPSSQSWDQTLCLQLPQRKQNMGKAMSPLPSPQVTFYIT